MRYLVKLKPLEAYFFGGEQTFGKFGNKEESNYLVKSRKFPQQTALLGAIRKEILIQANLLKKRNNGEWIDDSDKEEAKKLIGDTKFNFNSENDFKTLQNISNIFLIKEGKQYIKKVDIDSFTYKNGLLEGYKPKKDIYDNYIAVDNSEQLSSDDIFEAVEKTGNSKFDSENSLFKKTSYKLKDGFVFGFYIESDYQLKNSFVTLGGEKSIFKMEIEEDGSTLNHNDNNGYLTLLSDAYIDVPLKDNCTFAITSEISFRYLENEFKKNKRVFKKSKTIMLYEKGSIFIEPSNALITSLKNKNLQKIGLNYYAYNH